MTLKRKTTGKSSDTDEPAADRQPALGGDPILAQLRNTDADHKIRTSSSHKHLADNNNIQASKANGFVPKSRRTNSVDRANEIAGKEKKERQEQPDRP